jgi:hypothetical protein
MDQIVADMTTLDSDKDYAEKGRSSVRRLSNNLGVAYAKLPGEAWALGAGYAVGRVAPHADDFLDFFRRADDTDKKRVNVLVVMLVSLAAALLGILFSVLEHTRTLSIFRREAAKLAKGEIDQMFPSKFRGVYRKIASDLNDGIDKVAAKGGVPRRAADLTQVLGDLPAEPQMSAFALPGEGAAPAPSAPAQERPMPPAPAGPQLPKAMPAPPGVAADDAEEPTGTGHGRPPPPRRGVPPGAPPPPSRVAAQDAKLAEWQRVFHDFVATKQKCGESVDGFTYEKFEQTLRKNEEALIQRHGAARVKFTVYVKEGKAALKASPVKD